MVKRLFPSWRPPHPQWRPPQPSWRPPLDTEGALGVCVGSAPFIGDRKVTLGTESDPCGQSGPWGDGSVRSLPIRGALGHGGASMGRFQGTVRDCPCPISVSSVPFPMSICPGCVHVPQVDPGVHSPSIPCPSLCPSVHPVSMPCPSVCQFVPPVSILRSLRQIQVSTACPHP